jgi:ketosteroid isomerase-like protein
MSQENVELVRETFDRFMRGGRVSQPEDDLADDALSEFFDPEIEWVPVPQGVLAGSRYVGFEGLRRFWADFYAAWDELVVEPIEFREAGDGVVGVSRMKGRMRGLEIDETWSGLFTVRDARIVRVQGFASRDGALEAAGLRH